MTEIYLGLNVLSDTTLAILTSPSPDVWLFLFHTIHKIFINVN